MWTRLFVLSQLCNVIALVTGKTMYRMYLDDPEIFAVCPDVPDATLDINGLMNFDELDLSTDDTGENIYVKGNVTTVWDVQPDDRIVVSSGS